MSRILIAYTTNAGSTEGIARTIKEGLLTPSFTVDILQLKDAASLDAYDAVVIGAPMILGWHGDALKFIKKHAVALAQKKVAYFAAAMSLTHEDPELFKPLHLFLDPNLAKMPKRGRPSNLRERYTAVSSYLNPMLKAAPDVKPVSVAFFGGKLDMFRLKWWQAIFVMLVVQAKPGEFRNWDYIRSWGTALQTLLK